MSPAAIWGRIRPTAWLEASSALGVGADRLRSPEEGPAAAVVDEEAIRRLLEAFRMEGREGGRVYLEVEGAIGRLVGGWELLLVKEVVGVGSEGIDLLEGRIRVVVGEDEVGMGGDGEVEN